MFQNKACGSVNIYQGYHGEFRPSAALATDHAAIYQKVMPLIIIH